ncbi:MAG: hypothetical protein V1728_04875 [Candidatus Micrarchaeota archaeon]
MRFSSPFFLAVIALLLTPVLSADPLAGSINASGGSITPANISFVANSDRWLFFYGNATPTNATSFSVPSQALNDSSDSMRYISLLTPSYQQYLLSESSSDPLTVYSAPNLTAFDQSHGLSGINSVGVAFNSTSNFSLYTRDGVPAGILSLPTVYLPGYYPNGTSNPQAFREGLVQAGSGFIFVVPIGRAIGFDGRTFDYQFILPYSISSSNQFYAFAISSPLATSGGTGLPTVNYQWSFDGQTLMITTSPGATIVLHDELGKAYNVVADSNGIARLAVSPGSKYSLRLSSGGFQDATSSLYLPQPTMVEPTKPAPQPAVPSGSSKPQVRTLRTPQGLLVCIGDECYLREASESETQALLSELSCNGDVCQFRGNFSEIVSKYKLQPRSDLSIPRSFSSSPPFDVAAALAGVGPALSAQFSSIASASPDSGPVLFVIALCAGAGVILFLRRPGAPKIQGGYD